MIIHQQPGELIGLYHALHGAGARHAAAGLVRDVLLAESEAPTTFGRMFLARSLHSTAFGSLVESRWESGRIPSVEELVPLLNPVQNLTGKFDRRAAL